MDKLDFLDGSQEPVEELVPEVVEAPEPEPSPEPEPAPEPEAQPAPVATPVAQPEPGHVPLAAMLEERDKRKALEEQIRALQSKQPVPDIPDVLEDPEGYAAALNQQFQQRDYQTRLHFSEQLASVKHGADTLAKAKEWGVAKCDQDPHFNSRVASAVDPYEIVVGEYLKDQITSKVTLSDFEAFQAWKAAQAQVEAAAMQPAAPAAQPAPTRNPARPVRQASSVSHAAPTPLQQPMTKLATSSRFAGFQRAQPSSAVMSRQRTWTLARKRSTLTLVGPPTASMSRTRTVSAILAFGPATL